ncbi:hypothetical protein [Tropicimonas sp. IMCC6043]|uniref:hypothetical protein n=1 Tax=Tropicimonas sp. IMCC6043 TaxID=2510645 RepID=UPI00101C6CCA|nr:hypothetical protein [Tropicimonas sp. IMCC6043]RYH10554.1 hypothetical protein EU800_07335 [Tropicimonas sp. IMCC6043]
MRLSRLALPAILLTAVAACNVEMDPPDVMACKAAVAAQSNSGAGTTLVSREPAIDGMSIKVQDNGTGTVWQCYTDNAGILESIDLAS